jgi:N-acetylmuramoyl-L-alanine amidase
MKPHPGAQEGNRVFQAIARQEALRGLLAFSELHEQIRKRRMASVGDSDRDLFETERFILDEVLHLICARTQVLTGADSVVVALAEGSNAKETPVLVCRAASGVMELKRGSSLNSESRFLRDCLQSGRVLRCDDSETDPRAKSDYSHVIGARSSVIVPLRGMREPLGVLQAFSKSPWAFTDHDVRGLHLFAELILSALKPEDEDRRIHWLSDVAGDVLRSKSRAVDATSDVNMVEAPPLAELSPATETLIPSAAMAVVPALEANEPFVNTPVEDDSFETELEIDRTETLTLKPGLLSFLSPLSLRRSLPGSARPGLYVVLALVVVAALFSAGAWRGMEMYGKPAPLKKYAANTVEPAPSSPKPPSEPMEIVLSPAAGDPLMNPGQPDSDATRLSPVGEDKLAALPRITGVRHWTSSMGSTVVIDLEDQVPYEVHRLMSPERIYFDLHDTALSRELDGKVMDIGDASLSRVRVAQPVAGVTRVVLDTKDGSNFSVSMEANPYRLVVELRGSDKTLLASRSTPRAAPTQSKAVSADAIATPKTAPVAALTAAAPKQSSSVSVRLPVSVPARTGKFRIVLDAGHGGWDLGTVGRQGLLEKDLVLDVTQRLGKLLQSRLGSDVVFTRSSDTYLPLDQRADLANQAQADLFVSVHANYSSSATARGVETYYTNLFSSPGAREVEKHDDGTFTKPTPVALSADGLHEKIEESRRLATSVQHSLYATLAASNPEIRNRGIKDSAFAVLTGTTMPSILTEISFVSSPADEHALQSATYRQQIAEALYKGIARYQESSPRNKVAQLQKPSAR